MNEQMRAPAHRALSWIRAQRWCMQPEWLHTMLDIAERTNTPDMEAVLAKRGEALEEGSGVQMRGSTAIISVRGPIFRYANLFTALSGATSIEMLAFDMKRAADNPLVGSIVLDIDSPGGQANGVSELAQMIRAAASRKPVVAYVGGVAASGGYWLASGAPRIVISDTALLGSIGVVATVDVDDDENSVEIVSTQSPGKRPDVRTDEGRAQLQAQVDAMAGVFIAAVAANRDRSVETVLQDFGRGSVLVGRDAVNAGMADEIGSLEQVISSLNTSKGGISMSTKASGGEITREMVAELYPAIADEFRAEGRKVELERVTGVLAQRVPGHDALVEACALDGITTGPETAVKILAAERTQRQAAAAALAADSPPAVPEPAAPTVQAKPSLETMPIEERCKAEWQTEPELRSEFSDLDSYVAYSRNQAAGNVRMLRRRSDD